MGLFIKTLDSDEDHSPWEDIVVESRCWSSAMFRSWFLLLLLLLGLTSHDFSLNDVKSFSIYPFYLYYLKKNYKVP